MKRFIALFILFLIGCSEQNDQFIYYGRLDADVIRISAEVGEIIDSLTVDEGMTVQRGQLLALINTDKLKAKRIQQMAQLEELQENIKALEAQINQVDAQLSFAEQNLQKTKRMVANGAATENKMEELQTRVKVFSAQKESLKRNISGLEHKKKQLKKALEITELTIADSRIVSPLDGVVINRFHFENEFVGPGTPLFELSDLSMMEAKIYVPLADLNRIKLGQSVDVNVDGVKEPFEGTIRWISSESEFTPKTILTKETRTTLVYQIKIGVPNKEGRLKIGMPVDVKL